MNWRTVLPRHFPRLHPGDLEQESQCGVVFTGTRVLDFLYGSNQSVLLESQVESNLAYYGTASFRWNQNHHPVEDGLA